MNGNKRRARYRYILYTHTTNVSQGELQYINPFKKPRRRFLAHGNCIDTYIYIYTVFFFLKKNNHNILNYIKFMKANWHTMDREKISATKDEWVGAAKEKLGHIFGSEKMEAEGRSQKIHGENVKEQISRQHSATSGQTTSEPSTTSSNPTRTMAGFTESSSPMVEGIGSQLDEHPEMLRDVPIVPPGSNLRNN